jgi:(4S)-4-hydroxy-5-phosphonooxypentane-2,3-dione isomerase
MSARVILVEFVVRPEDVALARELILENAAASLRDEVGCLRFDVLEEPADPRRFVLYEIYRNPEDFDDHLQSPHFKSFSAATRDLFIFRSIREFDLQTSENEAALSSLPGGGS